MTIYVAVKETDKERLLGAYSRLDDAYRVLKEQTDVRPLSYVLQPMNQSLDKVEFNTAKPVTKAILEIRQNAFGLTQDVLVLE